MGLLFVSLAKLIAGVLFLVGGAEFLTHHSIVLARHMGVRPIVIGLTIIAFGTSAPEFFVTIMANLRGQADLAVGNIIGSNIANIGLILGVAAMIQPFSIPKQLARVELPFLMLSVILIGIAAWQGILSRLAAIILIISFCAYLYFLMNRRNSYTLPSETQDDMDKGPPRYLWRTILIIISFCGLVTGSHLLIEGAASVARFFHCPELIIGLSLTAVGTSLPELASTISALRRNETGLVIGNVLGSNFANSCGILGSAGLLKPLEINPHVFKADFPAMALFSFALIPIFRDGRISRLEGFMLFASYLCYVTIIYLKI